jgi:hypothetical protein
MTRQVEKRNTQSKSASQQASSKPKKALYFSFNENELKALESLGFRERWAYVALKRLVNFKTGVVGVFDNQKLSYVGIAALIVPPPAVQGRGEGGIDDTQAKDFLQRMEAIGLVANIGRRENGGLRFELPMSPIDRQQSSQSMPATGKMPVIFPATDAPEIAANQEPAWPAEQLDDSPSVMINRNSNINTEGAAPASGEAAPCRATGAAPARENPHPSAAVPSARLSAQEIFDAISGDWTFKDVDTPEARRLYESWAEAGITVKDLQDAMTSVGEKADGSQAPPADLQERLWPVVVDRGLNRLAA